MTFFPSVIHLAGGIFNAICQAIIIIEGGAWRHTPKINIPIKGWESPIFFLPKLRWGLNIIGGKMWVLSFVYTLFIPNKIKTTENHMISSRFVYP